MRVLILWPYYSTYLDAFYAGNALPEDMSFADHRKAIIDDHFGWAGDFSTFMNRNGVEAELYIGNDERLQRKWAKENGYTSYSDINWEERIALEQIRRYQPDVLWVASYFSYFGDFLMSAQSYCRRVIAWIACSIPRSVSLRGISRVITSHPLFLKKHEHQVEKIYVTKPGFNPDILSGLGSVPKRYGVTFVGQLSRLHRNRVRILRRLLETGVPVEVFASVDRDISSHKLSRLKAICRRAISSRQWWSGVKTARDVLFDGYGRDVGAIEGICRDAVYGMDMYRILAASRMTLNIHVDGVDEYAGNMRMFEATGVGACLVTEHAVNIGDLFCPGTEVLTYRSVEELERLIREMLWDHDRLEDIARNGQKRTLEHHTFERMWAEIHAAFEIP